MGEIIEQAESWGLRLDDATGIALWTAIWFIVYYAGLHIPPKNPPKLEALKSDPKGNYQEKKTIFNLVKVSFVHSVLVVIAGAYYYYLHGLSRVSAHGMNPIEKNISYLSIGYFTYDTLAGIFIGNEEGI